MEGRIREATGLSADEFYEALRQRRMTPQVVFNVDVGCNQGCSHCFAAVRGGADVEAVGRSVSRARALGYGTLLFPTEPSVDPRTISLYATAREDYLITNGVEAEPLLERMYAAGVRKLGVSLHGPDPETHGLLNGRAESFERIVATVRKASTRFTVQLKTVVHGLNLPKLQQHFHFAHRIGAAEVQLINLVKIGSAEDLPEHYFLSHDDALQTLREVAVFTDRHRSPRITFSALWGPNFHSRGVYQWLLGKAYAERPQGNRWCPGGRSYFAVVGQEVYACPNHTSDPDFVLGKWDDEDGIQLTREPWPGGNGDGSVGMCSPASCEYSHLCQGGCRLAALADSGDAGGSPSFCLTKLIDELLAEGT